MEEISLHAYIRDIKYCPEGFKDMLNRVTKDQDFTDDITGINYYDYTQLTLKKLDRLDGPSQIKLFRYFMLKTTFMFLDLYNESCELVSQQM